MQQQQQAGVQSPSAQQQFQQPQTGFYFKKENFYDVNHFLVCLHI